MVETIQMSQKPRKSEKTALMCAGDILSRQDHSEARLRQKLIFRKYSEEEIDDAIEKLKKYNYLNDERSCNNQFEIMYSSNRYSVRQICFKLVQLGFDDHLVESCVPKDYIEHDEVVAKRLLQVKFKTMPEDKKLWNFLSTKGFDYTTISSAINKFKDENDS